MEIGGGGVNTIEELKKAKETLINTVDAALVRLIQSLGGEETADLPTEYTYHFTTDTNLFIGKKPVAVLFGEERVEVKTWRKVFEVILAKCNADPQYHDNLMYLRDKVAGRDRILLSHSSDGMKFPLRIDEDMYAEAHYGTATLLYILRDRILAPARFDYSNISIVIKAG